MSRYPVLARFQTRTRPVGCGMVVHDSELRRQRRERRKRPGISSAGHNRDGSDWQVSSLSQLRLPVFRCMSESAHRPLAVAPTRRAGLPCEGHAGVVTVELRQDSAAASEPLPAGGPRTLACQPECRGGSLADSDHDNISESRSESYGINCSIRF
jgi:hypothetical protein